MIITPLAEEFTLDAVRLMAVQYSVSLGGFRKLVASDERFAIPASGAKAAVTTTAAAKDEAAQAEKRRLRTERKEKDRAARQAAEAQRRAARGRQ